MSVLRGSAWAPLTASVAIDIRHGEDFVDGQGTLMGAGSWRLAAAAALVLALASGCGFVVHNEPVAAAPAGAEQASEEPTTEPTPDEPPPTTKPPVKPSKKAAKRLKKAKKVTLTLRVTVKPPSGKAKTITKKVTLKKR